MEILFNSKDQNIANLVNRQLHTPSGQHIGNSLENNHIFTDLSGSYLGEIIQNNRLMYNVNYGCRSLISGYQDIATPWL